ncbi:MAG: MraY family glycosyltransferase [Alphaproteobacteria bacterium]
MIFYAVLAMAGVAALVPLARKAAPKVGLTDKPGGRKDHAGEIPLVGGVVIFPVFIALSLLWGDGLSTHWPLYAALLVLLVTGAVDDRVHLHSLTKFGLQFVAALLVVLPGGAELHQLGNLFGLGDFGLGFMSVPFSVVAVVLLINAINLMDGLDGLAGGVSFIILGWFLVACIIAGEAVFSPSIIILMAGLAGFLVYNMRNPLRRKASVFLGDAGSLCLGLMVGWYAIHLSLEETRVIEPISVAWVLAVPVWDECAQFYRRVREGRHPFSPDRGHFHHHFIAAGFAPGKAVFTILSVVALSGFIGVGGVLAGVPLAVLTVAWIAGILGHMGFSRKRGRYSRFLGRLRGQG